MPTVRYVNPSTGPYYSIQAAHDAAATGDTLLIAPGTYPRITLTKRIHLKGDTDDPIGRPVTISGDAPVGFALPSGSVGDLWIEGITLYPVSNSHALSAAYSGGTLALPSAITLRLNRCLVIANGFGYWGVINYSTQFPPIAVRFTNCQDIGVRYDTVMSYVPPVPGCQIAVIGHFGARPVWKGFSAFGVSTLIDAALLWGDGYVEDYKAVATEGYGAAYGSWYADQWIGNAYRVDGQIILPENVDRSLAKVRLYRRRNGVIDAIPWMITTPDPVTGAWEFSILPTDCDYFVWRMMPPGYQNRIDGPYIPVRDA